MARNPVDSDFPVPREDRQSDLHGLYFNPIFLPRRRISNEGPMDEIAVRQND